MDDTSGDIIDDIIEEDSSSTTSKRSVIYKHFEYKNSRYFCNYCNKNFSSKSTTTLWRHMNSKHSNMLS
jgi:transposase-like protein